MTKHHIYTKKSHLILVVLTLLALKQQAQIVVNNNAIINVNGGTASSSSSYLVLNTSATNPIKTIGTTGGIMMETEFSVTKYNVGPNTAAVTVPFNNGTSNVSFNYQLVANRADEYNENGELESLNADVRLAKAAIVEPSRVVKAPSPDEIANRIKNKKIQPRETARK